MMTAEKAIRSNVGAMVGKVSARIDAAGQEKTIWVKLEGVFLLDQAKELQTFGNLCEEKQRESTRER